MSAAQLLKMISSVANIFARNGSMLVLRQWCTLIYLEIFVVIMHCTLWSKVKFEKLMFMLYLRNTCHICATGFAEKSLEICSIYILAKYKFHPQMHMIPSLSLTIPRLWTLMEFSPITHSQITCACALYQSIHHLLYNLSELMSARCPLSATHTSV